MFKNFLNSCINRLILWLDAIKTKFLTTESPPELDLQDIQKFFEDYIGLIIVGFESYRSEIEDLDDLITGTMITKIFADQQQISISIANLYGGDLGELILHPTAGGYFAARADDASPTKASQFRLYFVGENYIEYLDANGIGQVEFVTEK